MPTPMRDWSRLDSLTESVLDSQPHLTIGRGRIRTGRIQIQKVRTCRFTPHYRRDFGSSDHTISPIQDRLARKTGYFENLHPFGHGWDRQLHITLENLIEAVENQPWGSFVVFQVLADAKRKVFENERTDWVKPKTGFAHVVLVMGPPGVGKSSLIDSLARACPRQNARVDSDHLGCTRPGGTNRGRLELIENNLFHCINNYREWGAEYIFCTWITEHQHRLDGLMTRLRAANVTTRAIALGAPCEELLSRISSRPDSRFEANQSGIDHLRGLTTRMHRLGSCKHIDTYGRSEFEVLKHVRELVAAPEYWQG